MSSNDNDRNHTVPSSLIDSSNAALLLVESLIHGLCENGTLSVGDAVAITARAADVLHDQAEVADGAGAPMRQAYELLLRIQNSLSIDDGLVPPGT